MDRTDQAIGMHDTWCWAVSWLRKPPSSPYKRAKQAALVAAILDELRAEPSPAALHARYGHSTTWTLAIARRLYPACWYALGVHACVAAAFGLRYVELQTGQPIDPAALPRWLGEWAIW